MSVAELDVLLERSNRVYYAGEVVRGTVAIVTTGNLNCKGFRIRLQGKASVHWHHGTKSGSNRRDYFGNTIFQSQMSTLTGTFYKTSRLDEAGPDALFDAVPNSGVIRIPCDLNEEQDDKFRLIVRVMDYDKGKRDDILGEIVIHVNALVHVRDQETFRLRRRGRAEQGQITVSAKWLPFESVFPMTSTSGERISSVAIKPLCLELTIHSATGLRKAGLLGQNDVYCQVYRVPEDSVIKKRMALPDPPTKIVLPKGRSLFSFAFDSLRTDAAPSVELNFSDYARLRWDLHVIVERPFSKDPCKNVPITVIANCPVPQPSLLKPSSHTLSDQPIHKAQICGCGIGAVQGLVSVKLFLSRRSFAVGEPIDLSGSTVDSTASKPLSLTILIVLYVEMSTRNGHSRTQRRHNTLWTSIVPPNSQTSLAQLGLGPETIRMPNLFPSFDGGVPVSASPGHYACLRWGYTIDIAVGISKCSVGDVQASVPVLVAAAPPHAHVLRELSRSPRLKLPVLEPFSIFSDVLFTASTSETTPRLTGPEDGGYYVHAIDVPEAITSIDEEEDGFTVGENPAYIPFVHSVAVSDSEPQAIIVMQTEATSALPKCDDDGETDDMVERLLAALDTSIDKRQAVGTWIRDHPTRAIRLTPEEVGLIFSKIQFALEQPSIAAELVACLKQNLTCAHVSAAVQACPYQQAEVARIMSPFVHDPDQKNSILASIDRQFERDLIAEVCFPVDA